MVDVVTQRRADVCGSHADGYGSTILRARPAGWSDWGHPRPPQDYPVHGDMDGRGGIRACRTDACRDDVPDSAPRFDLRSIVWRRLRITHLARSSVRAGGEGGSPRGVSSQWDGIQFRAGDRTGACRCGCRIRGRGRGVPEQCVFVLRRNSCCGPLETASDQARYAARDGCGSHARRNPIRALLAGSSQSTGAGRSGNVFCKRPSGSAALACPPHQ